MNLLELNDLLANISYKQNESNSWLSLKLKPLKLLTLIEIKLKYDKI